MAGNVAEEEPLRRHYNPLESLPTLVLDLTTRITRVEMQNDWITRSQGRADESRKEIHQKLEKLSRVIELVEEMKPIVMKLEQDRIMLAGAVWAGGLASKVGYVVLSAAAGAIGFVLHYYLTRH